MFSHDENHGKLETLSHFLLNENWTLMETVSHVFLTKQTHVLEDDPFFFCFLWEYMKQV